MRQRLTLCLLVGFALVAGCRSSQPNSPRPKTISLGIFEVVDCRTSGSIPMRLRGTKENYCLAAKPIVTEADVRRAIATHNSGRVQMEMYLSSQAGQRMKETTERLNAESSHLNAPPKMAVVIDGTLISVPTLRNAVSDRLMIEEDISWEEAVQIADSLNAGPIS